MRRLIIFLLVACSSFGAGVVVSWFRHMPSASSSIISALSAGDESRGRTYSRGLAGQATRGSFITLKSSDGMAFRKWSVNCASAEEAALQLKLAVRNAKVVSWEVNYGQNGERVGEKVVAFEGVDKSNTASLLWTENDEFFQVEAASLHDILEYRKDFHR